MFLINSYRFGGYLPLTTAWKYKPDPTVDTSILDALNGFEETIRDDSLIPKLVAAYVLAGGNADQHSYNFMNVSLYKIAWYGGITHGASGADFGGTNGYGDTGINPLMHLSQDDISLGLLCSETTSGSIVDFACVQGGNYCNLAIDFGGDSYTNINCATFSSASVGDSTGFFVANRPSSSSEIMYDDGTKAINVTKSSTARPNATLYLGARNNGGTAQNFSDRNYKFAFVGFGFTDTDEANLRAAAVQLQTDLGR